MAGQAGHAAAGSTGEALAAATATWNVDAEELGTLADGSITSAKVADGAIDGGALATSAVDKIVDQVWDEALGARARLHLESRIGLVQALR